ncbi:MAG: TrkH family potassium uptake protein [Candidatus Dadabacteria bacterium]|nr:TrkH family potassium uptake protein [Candidatus Dadabacteria bacterium]
MNIRLTLHIIGNMLKLLGVVMLIPAAFPLFYGEDDLAAILASAIITCVFGFALERLTKPGGPVTEFGRKEGFLVATLAWLGCSIFGALPLLIYGVLPNPVDAFFESVSGFTTTGASVIRDVEALPHGMLFWRSFTQWLGGMGIILLGIAILPRLAVGGMQLMGLEATGPTTEKITPRIAETAKSLWAVYVGLSALLVILLILAGMPVFESVLHSFSTLATGGFGIRNASVAAYNSAAIDYILTVFMFIGGTSFVLLYWLARGKPGKLWKSSEFRFYLIFNLIVILFIAFEVRMTIYPSFLEALRYSSFQVISISTTTGFVTANYDLWPTMSQWLLLLMMFAGGCAGSTSGAIKNIRLVVLFKKIYQEMQKLIYPRSIIPIRVDRKPVAPEILSSVSTFCLLYVLIFAAGTFLLAAAENLPVMTAASASATALGNVGPGMGEVGPVGSFAGLTDFSKVVLAILMLLGRLELFTVLVLFTSAFWRK